MEVAFLIKLSGNGGDDVFLVNYPIWPSIELDNYKIKVKKHKVIKKIAIKFGKPNQ